MKYKVKKSGNSTTITIPPYIVEKLDIKLGDTVDVDYEIKGKSKKIIITKEEN